MLVTPLERIIRAAMKDDAPDAIWELAEFAVREAFLLRSFLTYLRDWDDLPEKKLARIRQWEEEIGLLMGNPSVADEAKALFQRLRDALPAERRAIVQQELAKADSRYLGRLSG